MLHIKQATFNIQYIYDKTQAKRQCRASLYTETRQYWYFFRFLKNWLAENMHFPFKAKDPCPLTMGKPGFTCLKNKKPHGEKEVKPWGNKRRLRYKSRLRRYDYSEKNAIGLEKKITRVFVFLLFYKSFSVLEKIKSPFIFLKTRKPNCPNLC